MINKIASYNCRPALDAPSTGAFWDDEHISTHMMEAHLNPHVDSASRNHTFVKKSAKWIASAIPPAQNRSLLDLGCGPGLYAEWFHQLGLRLPGLTYPSGLLPMQKNQRQHTNWISLI